MDLQIRYGVDADGTRKAAIPDDSRAWASSFIREQGARSNGEIEAVVQEGQDALLAAIAGLSDGQASFKPSDGEWSILDAMAHVVTTKQVVVALCGNLGRGERPPGIGPEWEEERAQDGITAVSFTTIADARAAAQAAHGELLALIRAFDASTNLEVRFRHYIFGALNAREWSVFQRIHDGDHTPQIERLMVAPGFQRRSLWPDHTGVTDATARLRSGRWRGPTRG
ncbi:MAG: DinB family protein [Dehalococcoidia bacterium]